MDQNLLMKQRELNDRLNRYRNEYYNLNSPSVSDAVYDRLFEELQELESATGVQMSNSPTNTVGYPAVSKLEKTNHSIPLLSLDKVKNAEDLCRFMGEHQVMFMLKLDGLTIKLTYEGGKLVEAATRGDGDVGEIVTHNTRAIGGIPENIQYEDRLVVTGEAFIRPSDFEQLKTTLVDSDGKPYLNALYSGRLHLDFSSIRRHQFPILTYAVRHGKKHFLDLVSEHSELFLSLGRYALLFEDKFCEHCNLNSLTARNLQACDTVERGSSHFDLLEDGRQYTFEEMWLLWQQDEIYVRLYAMLTPLSVDRRLLTLRQLLKHGLVSHHMEDQELEQLARCLLEKPFSEWYRGAFGHIRGLTRRTAMWLLRKYEQLRVFIPEMQSEADAIFALNNGAVIAGQKNWTQVRAAVLTMDRDWLDLKERFSITDEFVEQHREPVTNFLLRGGSAMVRSLYDYLQGNDKAIEALRRIVQAELMGQFYALKYFADDLQREIRYPISEVQEAAWKRNLTLDRGPFSAEEADDFYFTMRLGELPHSTCLSCWTGSQRDCLLAAFDSNKKMILIRKGEDIVARACIRLTKGAFQRPADFDFSFADLAQEQPAGKMGAGDEMLILFLERIYTSGLNDEEAETAMRMAVSLVTQKAAAIGAVAVLARRYLGCYDRDQYVGSRFYVYISKSKNGQQYLDSMGGAAVTSHKEQYTGAVFLVEQAAMRTAAPQKEDEFYE